VDAFLAGSRSFFSVLSCNLLATACATRADPGTRWAVVRRPLRRNPLNWNHIHGREYWRIVSEFKSSINCLCVAISFSGALGGSSHMRLSFAQRFVDWGVSPVGVSIWVKSAGLRLRFVLVGVCRSGGEPRLFDHDDVAGFHKGRTQDLLDIVPEPKCRDRPSSTMASVIAS